MPGLNDFLKTSYSPRAIVVKTGAYTLTASDEQVNCSGTFALTFPALSTVYTMVSGGAGKPYRISNTGTGIITLTPATGDTIGGRPSWPVYPNQDVVVFGSQGTIDWEMALYPIPAQLRHTFDLVVETNGTTAVNVFDSSGCAVDLTILDIRSNSQDTVAGNILTKNGTTTVATVAKGTTAGASVSATTLTSPNVAKGSVFTVESSSTGNSRVHITCGSLAYVDQG